MTPASAYAIGAAAAVAFAVWGSLFPFVVDPVTPAAALTALLRAWGRGPASWSISDFVSNVLLFVPFGALVVLIARWPWWAAALVATAASAAIEVVQYLPVLHRQATLADVICNGLGALLGAVLAHLVVRRDDQHATSTPDT